MAMLWKIIPIVALCACHNMAGRPVAQERVHGSVRTQAGDSTGVVATITVTDVRARREIAVLHTDASGKFMLDVAPSEYALAVTSAAGFAYLDKVKLPSQGLVITLSSSCHRLRGRLSGGPAFPAAVSLTRISRDIGDRFVIPITGNSEFAGCLSEGVYSTRVEGAAVSLTSPVVIPTSGTIELEAYVTSEIQHVPTNIHLSSTDFDSFAKSLRDHRVVGLGEANHGTGDFYTYRGKLSLELARSGNLRTILLEADAIAMMKIDDYVMGGATDLRRAVADIGFWICDIEEFIELLTRIRDYNASVPLTHKIHVLGIDAQRIEPPVRFLLAHRSELAISDHEASLLDLVGPDRGAAFAKLSDDDRAALLAVLGRLATPGAQAGIATSTTRASIAARSVRYQLDYVGKTSTGALRDLAMAELAAYIVTLDGSGQVALWAHNGHLARQHDGVVKSLGQHLLERFGDAYYPIAFLSYRGEGRAWDRAGKIGVIPHELTPTPPYNVESVVMKATAYVDVAWVRFDVASERVKQWLSLPRYVREFGSAFDPQDTQTLRAFPGSFAAVVVIGQATSSTPTPTGIRKAKQ